MTTVERFLRLFRFLAISPAEVAEYPESKWVRVAELLKSEVPSGVARRYIVNEMLAATEIVGVGGR